MGWGEKRGKKKELAEIRKTLKGMNKMILKYRAGETKEFKRYTKMSKKAGIYTGAISELNTHTQLDQNSKRRLDRSKFGHVESSR